MSGFCLHRPAACRSRFLHHHDPTNMPILRSRRFIHFASLLALLGLGLAACGGGGGGGATPPPAGGNTLSVAVSGSGSVVSAPASG